MGVHAIAYRERSSCDRFADYLLPSERLANERADSGRPLGGINDQEMLVQSGRDEIPTRPLRRTEDKIDRPQ